MTNLHTEYYQEGGDDGYYPYEEEEADPDKLTQEDCWTVIASFFERRGLVRQQLDSFNEFINNTIQDIVEDSGDLNLEQHEQHTGNETDQSVGALLLVYQNLWQSDAT